MTKKTKIQIGNPEKGLGRTSAMKLRRKTARWLRQSVTESEARQEEGFSA
jgi:hypothetical protein